MTAREHWHPVLASWFSDKYGEATDVQLRAWPLVAAGAHTLIAAPTGSGKTLAALMPLLNRLVLDKLAEPARRTDKGGVRILYVTPLKALNNDIREHLFDYTAEWKRRAETAGMPWPGITVGVRTGDTTQNTRASMLRHPPDVLVTTPESLYILLTSPRAREMLRTVRHVVVDEIHDLAASERGVHFSLTLERLSVLCDGTPQRIGVSATINPAERIARYLGGQEEAADGQHAPRPVEIVESDMNRRLEVRVTVPAYGERLLNRREDVWTPLVEEILRHTREGATTLIFVGNRRLCERLSSRLNEMCGEGFCRSHHGSVSRERRLETEQLLREGKLRCLVATSSLELGIDIGDVDHVLQIDSLFTAASGIQRFGRAGHRVGGISRGTIIVRSRGLLPEVAVLAARIHRKQTEPIQIPRHLGAVLAQQIVAIVSQEEWRADDLYRLIRRSDNYDDYPREQFDELLDMLCGACPSVRPLIDRDPATGVLRGFSSSAYRAVTGSGTIPSSTNFPVYHAETRVHLGELDEEYVFESRVGDVFQLGATNWRIRSIRSDRVEVIEAGSGLGEIPFWRAEGQGRSFELSLEIGELVERLVRLLDEAQPSQPEARQRAEELLMAEHHLSAEAAQSLISLIQAQRAASAMPSHRRIVVEWFTDDSGMTHVVIHSWFGRRFNRTWLLALQHHLEREYPHDLYTTAKDNGIELVFRVWDPLLLERIRAVNSRTIERTLLDAVPTSQMFAARFRQLAETSLLLTRGFQRTPSWLKRVRGDELLRAVMAEGTSFPLLKETYRECMEQLLDLHHVRQVLRDVEEGHIEYQVVRCDRPSPLATQFFFDFLNVAIYESDALTRDLKQRMAGISRQLAIEVFGSTNGMDGVEVPTDQSEARTEEGAAEGLREANWHARLDVSQYMKFLQLGHRLHPSYRLQGTDGVLEALSRLQGVYLPLSWWESFVLPSRVNGYRREDLDLLCASGDIIWLGRKEDGQAEGKIAFFRADAPELYAPFLPDEHIEPCHPDIYELLRTRGASFLTQLARDAGEEPSSVLGKLIDLVWQGLVTNDQFAPVRMHGQRRAAAANARGKFRSGLGRWYLVRDLRSDAASPQRTAGGVDAASVDAPMERSVLAWTRHLLRMYGIITRSLVQSYSPFAWEVHLAALVRMEELGLVTRGLFIRDIQALQFAEREIAERLGETFFTGDPANGEDELVALSAVDPANPYGLTVEWPNGKVNAATAGFARKPGNYMLLRGGRFLLWAANNGRKLTPVDASASDLQKQAEYIRFTARCLIREQGQRKVKIESWNGQPIARTELAEHLARLGAERDGQAFVLWPSNVS